MTQLFAVLIPIWVPATPKMVNSAGRTVEVFTVQLRRVAVLRATCAVEALAAAKQAGHFAPIIEHTQELQ